MAPPNPLHAWLPRTEQVTLYCSTGAEWVRLEACWAEVYGVSPVGPRWIRHVLRQQRYAIPVRRSWTAARAARVVVLDGWMHPDPRPRIYPAGDARWSRDFHRMLIGYLSASPGAVTVLRDYRGTAGCTCSECAKPLNFFALGKPAPARR